MWSFFGRKRQSFKLNQCSAFVQRSSTMKRGFLIIKHMAHWRNNIKYKTFLFLFLISIFKSSFTWLKIFLKWLMSFALIFFCSWLNFKISFNCCRKNNRLFLQNNRLFWVWQHCEEINLIAILNFYPLQINSEREFKELVIESWSRSERSYNCHKGIYSKILEIQEP